MFIDITPVAKPRMTQRDRWATRPAVIRYRAFCDELRLQYKDVLPPTLMLTFYLPMPPSWSAKKRREHKGHEHTQKPDVDNLSKAVMDALCEDDSYIYALYARKYWAEKGGIIIDTIPVI